MNTASMNMGHPAPHPGPIREFRQAQPAGPLTSYVTPLSIPPVLRPQPGATVPIRMVPFQHKAHRDLPAATFWGYNNIWPGPTFEVRRGQPLTVKWTNELPLKHFLPIDPTIHGCEPGVPEVRTVTHVHGAQVLPESDGYPDSWFTPDGKFGAVPGANPTRHPNDQPATTLCGITTTLSASRASMSTPAWPDSI